MVGDFHEIERILCNQKWCLGFAEVRRLVLNGAIQVNDVIAVDADMELNNNDIVKCGKHRVAIVKEN